VEIAVLLGSTRPGRKGDQVARWVLDRAQLRTDATYHLLDLADFELDLLDSAVEPSEAGRSYENPRTERWSRAVDSFDAFVWVTPEYNHGVPAAMKNAFDVLYPEWGYKAAGIVGYGILGAARAAEQWRGILVNARLHTTRAQLAIQTGREVEDGAFVPAERRERELDRLLDELVQLATALRPLRT
jgi:NAD(P)H-dependent FMN reductase